MGNLAGRLPMVTCSPGNTIQGWKMAAPRGSSRFPFEQFDLFLMIPNGISGFGQRQGGQV
jgi:hypothetical protein